MLFKDFIYTLHDGVTGEITFQSILTVLNEHHHGLGDINVYSQRYETPSEDAFFRRVEQDRSSPYGEEFWHVEVHYCNTLDDHPRQRRYALTKELTHVFDDREAWAGDKEAFQQLLRDIQNDPLPDSQNSVYKADIATRWKALVTLCPVDQRNAVAARAVDLDIEDYEIAARFGVPIWTVPWIVDDYFLTARQTLMNGGSV